MLSRCQFSGTAFAQVDFILEREKNSKFLREGCRDETTQFQESDELFDSEGCCGKHRFTRFLARMFGMEYKRHLKLVKEIEERNNTIFNDVMVSNLLFMCVLFDIA